MRNIEQKELINALEQQVENHLQDAVKIFQNLNEKKLLQPGENGGWSIAQCLWHLNSYGDFYLPEIKKALEVSPGINTNNTFKGSWLGNYFTKMMDPETGKKKYKAFKSHVPGINLNPHEVVAEFIKQQETLLLYLHVAKEKNLDKIKLPISISRFIKLKLGDVFQFLIAHDERHILQAKNNLK